MSVSSSIATKFFERIVYGLGFGLGMGLSWQLTNQLPKRHNLNNRSELSEHREIVKDIKSTNNSNSKFSK